MYELIVWLVVVAFVVLSAMKKNGTLDRITKDLERKQKKNRKKDDDNVVFEQSADHDAQADPWKKNRVFRLPGKLRVAAGAGICIAAVVFTGLQSYYTLTEQEMAVVTTFGSPAVEETSGLHFKLPFIQKVTKVSKAIVGMQIGYTTDPQVDPMASPENPVNLENESLMITKDFNLTNVDFYIEYMVTDPIQAVRHRSVYEDIIKNLAQSYIRDTVGMYNVDDVITTGKTQIQERIKELLTNRLVEENIGYGIYNVSIQDSNMPRDDVSDAFKAVEDAKQGMETAINEAKNTSLKTFPRPGRRRIRSFRRLKPINRKGSMRPADRWPDSKIHMQSM